MSDKSTIEWTEATWNPITGCTLVSDGCRHCYAAELAATRLSKHPSRAGLARRNAAGEAKFTGEVRFNKQWLDQPLRWRRGRHIFVCAHGDLFHESVPDDWIDQVFAVMALSPQHIFQVLTKRPERARRYFEGGPWMDWVQHFPEPPTCLEASEVDERGALPNVWLGTSVENQETAEARIPELMATPAAVRFVSAEPLLGPVELDDLVIDVGRPGEWHVNCLDNDGLHPDDDPHFRGATIDWVIVGGESGRHARPMHPDWARALRDQCRVASVPFFFKQWGAWAPGEVAGPNKRAIDVATWWDDAWLLERVGKANPDQHYDEEPDVFRVGKKAAGRLLDGREWSEVPG